MQQLSWTDDMLLRAETPATPLQIQLLLIYDPSTAPGGKVTFKGILEELDARLHLADVFRQRLTGLPAGLDRPYWVDDPNFDLEYHVRHIGLPQPGDWRQLCIQVARLHGRQIDLRRPPWEITVIEGLNSVPGVPKGSFAMALQLHHCAADAMAREQMIAAMHDPPAPSFPPKTRFNQTVSPHRVFEARFHDLADFKRIKARVAGSTVNDVALAYVGGALRHYLADHGELPDESLVAACPISLRDASANDGKGNMLFGRLQSLGTDIADPLVRLATIAESTAGSRSESGQSTRSQLIELIGTVPTSLLGVAAKAASVLPFSGPNVANTTVTNVPGPSEPIYFCGARLLRAAGLGPLIGGMNLIHVVASYNGTLSISATADRDALPDPANYAHCMEHAFKELLSIAG